MPGFKCKLSNCSLYGSVGGDLSIYYEIPGHTMCVEVTEVSGFLLEFCFCSLWRNGGLVSIFQCFLSVSVGRTRGFLSIQSFLPKMFYFKYCNLGLFRMVTCGISVSRCEPFKPGQPGHEMLGAGSVCHQGSCFLR